MSDKISELLKSMSGERVTERKLIEAAGEMAHEILADTIRELKANKDQGTNPEGDDEDAETVETEFDTPDSPSGSEDEEDDNSDEPGHKASEKAPPFDRNKLEKAMQTFKKRFKAFSEYWAKIDEIEYIEMSEFDQNLTKLNRAWEDFARLILKFKQQERK
ncbi:hypothetical protein EG834_06230 [bacterium]|nr:hypothetical protein [bacterium]